MVGTFEPCYLRRLLYEKLRFIFSGKKLGKIPTKCHIPAPIKKMIEIKKDCNPLLAIPPATSRTVDSATDASFQTTNAVVSGYDSGFVID